MKHILLFVAFTIWLPIARAQRPIIIGSKPFTESYLLAELAAQMLEAVDYKVERKFGLGGTGILFEALTAGEIDLYFEYTGTISEAILKSPGISEVQMVAELSKLQLVISKPLGFANNYALGLRRDWAEKHNIEHISDLLKVDAKPKGAFSHEFATRADGLNGLERHYDGPLVGSRQSMEHSLAYTAIENGKVEIMDVYTTDAKISRLDLVLLKDNLKFFPQYEAVILANKDFVDRNKRAWLALQSLENSIDEKTMQDLNAKVDIDRLSFGEAIAGYLGTERSGRSVASKVWQRTKEHFVLVLVSLLTALLIGLPLGVLGSRRALVGQLIVLLSSLFQTIPSLALLCFLIPIFGIGTVPALVALFLYSLLPIVVGTTVGLRSIDPKLLEVSHVLSIKGLRRLLKIEMPLASASIITGVRTAAIISIGTATLAALIGAGGYGAPIVTGLAMNDISTILLGAVPAAVMAIATHLIFEALERILIPKGLRLRS